MEVMNKRLSTVEMTSSKNSEKITSNTEEIKELKKQVKETSDHAKQSVQPTQVRDVIKELNLRQEKRNNVVIHKVDEPKSNTKEDRMLDDFEVVVNLAEEIGVILDKEKDVKFQARLGKYTAGKTRPLLIGFNSSITKGQFMENAHKLKDCDDPWCHVRIVDDLTIEQRKEEDDLRTQVKGKNEALTDEESKNWEWRVVGRRGNRRITKASLREGNQQQQQRQSQQQQQTETQQPLTPNQTGRKRTTGPPPQWRRAKQNRQQRGQPAWRSRRQRCGRSSACRQ
jgi:hypothetical protein